jgi:isopenicillin-N epimerase
LRDDFAKDWAFEPGIRFLNHGSFGACPRVVLERQSELRAQLEAQPVEFFVRRLEGLLDEARAELARFLGADPEGLAFVSNATQGVNTVLRSLALEPGDELLVTDHEYNACRNALDVCAERSGARVVVARLPFRGATPDALVERILERVGARTRLALIDHVTSPTALVLPAARLVRELAARGVETLVDGAHAPGMVPLALDALGAAYYTGNCHKWLCAPKGAAFLYVRADRRVDTRPLAISHGANAATGRRSRFRNEFDWTGTLDPTPWLCVPTALGYLESRLPGGMDALRRHNHALVLRGRDILCRALALEPPVPDELIGSMAALPLPDGDARPTGPLYSDAEQERIWREHRIEVPIAPWPTPPARLLRISAQLYNEPADYEALAEALLGARA